ncbi:MAG: PIG-L family deacetylase [Gemmatimonadales bacterium]
MLATVAAASRGPGNGSSWLCRLWRRGVWIAVAVLAYATAPVGTLSAQTGGAGTGGMVRLAQEERQAGNWRRVLMIGAHPDDEDTELLTILSRGMGIESAYLSLTRGDGGQNLIGSELGEALGVLRTEELASARRIDGAEQFFTRAYDFGFSKTAAETLRFWNHDSTLKDIVRIIRRFRPQVIVSVWSGTPADGHGHHQASGILSLEAYHAAGDPNRFPELATQEGLTAWQAAKFYRSPRGGVGGATLTFNGGVIDPATGLTLHQLAMRSRSQHRSQNQGNLENLGPAGTGLRLEVRAPGITGPDDSLFAGITPEREPAVDPHAAEALLTESRIVVDATTTDDEVTPGESLPVTVTMWNAGHDSARVTTALVPHEGFSIRPGECAGEHVVAPGVLYNCTYAAQVTPHAALTTPYYLDRPRFGAMYQWSGDPRVWGEPSAPPFTARFTVALPGSESGTVVREIEGRFRDPVIGEVRRPVMIVPRVAVGLQPGEILWPSDQRSRSFTVSLEHLSRDSMDATVSLTVPPGWTTTAPQPVHFAREGERAMVTFKVTAPRTTLLDRYHIDASVAAGNDTFATGLYRIRYPHVRAENMAIAAQSNVVVSDVTFPVLTAIGYVRGGGDLVPEAMANAGLPVTLLTGDALERGPLKQFKVIVIGPRAYEADESLVRAHPRLMRWLDAGGTLIIQYEQQPYMRGGFAPKPLTFTTPTQSRVTDETAPVTLLAKTQQVLRWPNPIGDRDFDGWVQERGLDFPIAWDPAWTPVLETHDPGDTPRAGGLLIAKVGAGTAIYTGLSFHRQLPALVPGAWRLWANLLSAGLSPKPTRAPAR